MLTLDPASAIAIGNTTGPFSVGKITLAQNGQLWGTGTINGVSFLSGTHLDVLNTGGLLHPGFSPGRLTIGGSYTQNDGVIELSIGGSTPVTGYSSLLASDGVAINGGTIRFVREAGYAGDLGATLDFLLSPNGVVTVAPGVAIDDQTGLGLAFDFATGSARITQTVPEPALAALLAAGCAGLGWIGRRGARLSHACDSTPKGDSMCRMRLGSTALGFLAAAVLLPRTAGAVTPANGGMVGGTVVAIDVSPGDQLDPHVSGDIAAHTQNGPASPTIRYFDFQTSAISTIPPEPGAQDTLSGVDGDRITFARQHADGSRSCQVFDVASMMTTEINSGVGAQVFATGLGADTVAFVDANSGNGDIRVGSLANPSALAVTLSAAGDLDTNPAVSPSGDLVVWERCIGDFTQCDIAKSSFTGSWGALVLVSDSTGSERNPDTDGVNIVYDSNRPLAVGGQDVFYAPVSSGPETQLEIAGEQRNPSIADGIIAFESRAPAASVAEVFVYEISTNTLFQVTATPTVNETLNDVTVLPNGDVRVIWAANDDLFGENNIYARTFSLPSAGDTTAPVVAIATPADGALYTKSQLVLADYGCVDEPGGSGLASCVGPVAPGVAIDTASVGGHLFAVTGADNAGNAATLTHGYGVTFCVNPFAPPVDDLPVLNRVNAGRAIPVKFSLCGDQGLAIFAAGFPKSQQVACDSSATVDGIEETTSAGNSSLSYDPIADQYKYVWKSERSWAGSCRQLVLLLSDGTYRRANFQFR